MTTTAGVTLPYDDAITGAGVDVGFSAEVGEGLLIALTIDPDLPACF